MSLVVKWFTKVPGWAALSLVMNALLFGSLIAVWQDQAAFSNSAELLMASEQPLDTLDSSLTDAAITDTQMPQPEGGRKLSYEQWVAVLDSEAQSMEIESPDHLTVLLGDSLSLWFPGELMPGRRVWMNQSISGEKTQGLLNRLNLIKSNKVEAVFLMIGINDLIWGKTDAEIIANYKEIVRQLKQEHPDTQIVVQSILPHGGENSTWESRDKLLTLKSDRIVSMNNALKEIAADSDAYYLDLYPIFVTGEGELRDDLTTDGLHLNRQGYLVWRSAIALYAQLKLE